MGDGRLLLHGRRPGKCRNRNTCFDDEGFLRTDALYYDRVEMIELAWRGDDVNCCPRGSGRD